jgi:hypothetical protein
LFRAANGFVLVALGAWPGHLVYPRAALAVPTVGTGEIVLSGIILLGASLVPFLLIGAMVRGGWRARQERAVRRQQIKDFE